MDPFRVGHLRTLRQHDLCFTLSAADLFSGLCRSAFPFSTIANSKKDMAHSDGGKSGIFYHAGSSPVNHIMTICD